MTSLDVASLFYDGPEYTRRLHTDYRLPEITLKQIHEVIPKDAYEKDTLKGLSYVARDIAFATLFYQLAKYIDPFSASVGESYGEHAQFAAKWAMWSAYWWWQGICWAGIWTLGHEAGHGGISSKGWVNNVVGFTLHTFLLVPYFSWRASHHLHHKSTGSLERDENFVPPTRTDLKLQPHTQMTRNDYKEIFEETPIFTFLRIVFMQAVGMQAYFAYNALGNKMYPAGTNHFNPNSALFKESQRNEILLSDAGLIAMLGIVGYWINISSLSTVTKYYIIPYLLANHWIVMLTYLHHTDPTMPHFRKDAWTFVRGAITTVDRPLLGWVGRFFLHNVSHDHVAHHLISAIPHYNGPRVTEALKKVLGEDYNQDSTNTFRALWRTFNECQFIEDDGAVAFYADKTGHTKRKLEGQ
ncbi:delta-12 fatty acid desaturase [Cantharellus anzutake]|uniref:delta-12 fatty acid desaturase n=1 Tax=Cantharellus anzutake TaxID=1750568 RepID=UPI001904434A|nr:delta-12 fatty acid desaturase [Cantharellus anzutake]KAF8341432.1 delta-12 fatty acid desaturase [Cantharellus anzutake]